jgi:hypothetical protein
MGWVREYLGMIAVRYLPMTYPQVWVYALVVALAGHQSIEYLPRRQISIPAVCARLSGTLSVYVLCVLHQYALNILLALAGSQRRLIVSLVEGNLELYALAETVILDIAKYRQGGLSRWQHG